ncbi:MAG: DUF11 domain-containing protein, partial [Dehalococcoidales bacterium]|nr:DUF11 domain-containing protein [Dehalococcoidales bacterium]
GPSDATGVEVTDVLPAGLTFESSYAGEGSVAECGGTITWNGFDLAAGESAVLTIETVAAVQMTDRVIVNEACADCDQSDPDSGNNTAGSETLVYSPWDTVGGEVAPVNRLPIVYLLSVIPILAAAFFIIRLARRRTG